jgi:hypothetical protein
MLATANFHVSLLVDALDEAIAREKQIKSGSRKDKLALSKATILFGTVSEKL